MAASAYPEPMGDSTAFQALDGGTIPADWADVTPAWMTAALQRDHPGVEVAAVEVLQRDDGTNRRGRLGIGYATGVGPEVVFVKAEGAHREAHARNGNLFNEPELFANRVELPVDHPRPYHVVIDRPALDYVIVMEDITLRGGEPRDATRPLSVAQVAGGLTGLAALHAHYRGVTAAGTGLGWLEDLAPTPGWQAALRNGVIAGVEKASRILPAEVRARGGEQLLADAVEAMAGFVAGPPTLLHADPHIGNTYVLPGDEVGFLDWQVCHRGNWAHDVAYFLVSALTVDDRRSAEHRLLRGYLEASAVAGGEPPELAEAETRYAAAHAYGLAVWLATLNNGRAQSAAVCRALVERYAAAYLDADTPAALRRLRQLHA